MSTRRVRWICALCLVLVLVGCRTQRRYETSPVTNHGARWRIGYYEGGPWVAYQGELLAFLDGLAKLGWIEPLSIPDPPSNDDTSALWTWLSQHANSDYVEFVADAYWSANWEHEQRLRNQADCIQRLTGRDLDLIVAAGTWAGLDLANDRHSVPTLVISTSNPIEAGIIQSAEDSGLDHVHARCDPYEQVREIRIFHDILQFRRVGVIYDETVSDGRIYAALPELEKVATERDFEIVTCHAQDTQVAPQEANRQVRACLQWLAPQIDAFYVTAHLGLTADFMPETLQPLFDYRVPTWAQEGAGLIENGVLMSIARKDARAVGTFYAETTAKILHGASPRELDQLFVEPKRIAINMAAARIIGYEPPSGLITSADQVFTALESAP